ncbi:MAG: cation acetate symporter [Desulfuromonas sp.]|nr:cation acetate symporter [Desulfuromonas sp.]
MVMLAQQSTLAVLLFLLVIALVVGLSCHLIRRSSSPAGYFVASGSVHWGVNGISFVGDYLSAASFLGVGGMIAVAGYDGFLYSIGFLSGWVVLLLLLAEPVRRLGHFTFTDAIDAYFQSRGLRLAAAISTLVVSIFYLIPQMVGAGALITPLLGVPHYVGVLLVGSVVTIIVATSGMVSTTYVQCFKGALLLVVSLVLVGAVLERGFTVDDAGVIVPVVAASAQPADARSLNATGVLGPLDFLQRFYAGDIYQVRADSDGSVSPDFTQKKSGAAILSSGGLFNLASGKFLERIDFISLMLALICGTAALPHILIRYYTVSSNVAARKSTIVAISGVGLFYLLSLFIGLGAMASGTINLADSNMAVPLLAKSFGIVFFAIVTAIAFSAVLGTVSGLIIAASGAVAHDIMDRVLGIKMTALEKVAAGRIAAVIVGCVAIYLGLVFEGMNVSYLAGWAFAVAASANLPALLMALFWQRTTSRGVVAAILSGLVISLALILLSPEMYLRYGYDAIQAPVQLNHPAIIAMPISLLALIVVSLRAKKAPLR